MGKTEKKVRKIGRNLLDMLLGADERLIKKYALDSEGKLKLYTCPEVQAVMLKVLRDNGLIELLRERETDEEDCDC